MDKWDIDEKQRRKKRELVNEAKEKHKMMSEREKETFYWSEGLDNKEIVPEYGWSKNLRGNKE